MECHAKIALAIAIIGIVFFIREYNLKKGSSRKALAGLVVAVFVALIVLRWPLAADLYKNRYVNSQTEISVELGLHVWWLTLLQCMQDALRTFVLDGSWSEVLASTQQEPSLVVSAVALILSVIAPVLTFSAILAMFPNVWSKLRFFKSNWLLRWHPIFFVSELNRDSLALANSIRTMYGGKAQIIITDVFPDLTEENYELLKEARRLHVIMLKDDISSLSVCHRIGKIEYFLLGKDESENIRQAGKIYERLKGRKKVSIYVWARDSSETVILDNMIDADSIWNQIPETARGRYETVKKSVENGDVIRLRRIDPEMQTAWSVIPQMTFLKRAAEDDYSNEIVSILIIAKTRLSFAFLKMLLWYCQSDKYILKLNIVYNEKADEKQGIINVRSLLERECPGIVSTDTIQRDSKGRIDDAVYQIHFIESCEFQGSDFWYSDSTNVTANNYLTQTTAVIIDSGSDQNNLAEAIRLRERLGRELEVFPEMYVALQEEDVYRNTTQLKTYQKHEYNFHTFGGRENVYSYSVLTNTDLERGAFSKHIKWIDTDRKMSSADSDDNRIRNVISYEDFEYFRLSSISSAIFMENIISDPEKSALKNSKQNNTSDIETDTERYEERLVFRDRFECINNPGNPKKRWECNCENCDNRRRLEHRRWNAYMQTQGYRYGEERQSRSLTKQHKLLKPFSQLPEEEKKKDN